MIVIPSYGQSNRPKIGSRAIEKIEQMEMAKLIQVLDLNEETSARFFARRKEHREKIHSLMQKRRELINEVDELLKKEENPEANVFKIKFNELLEIDKKIVNEKNDFYKSLFNILSSKQVLNLIAFDEKFRREIRETIFNRMRSETK